MRSNNTAEWWRAGAGTGGGESMACGEIIIQGKRASEGLGSDHSRIGGKNGTIIHTEDWRWVLCVVGIVFRFFEMGV